MPSHPLRPHRPQADAPTAAPRRRWTRAGIAVLAAAVALPAFGQYKWRDANGRVVYSDQPPPGNVPQAKVLSSAPIKPVPDSGVGRSAWRDAPSAEDKERQAAQEQKTLKESKAKQRADTERLARNAQACDAARADLRMMESGMRVAQIRSDGEREYLSDEDRAKRVSSAQRAIKDLCGQ